MPAIPVIAVFDIGKTNKKLFLFDEQYRIVYEESICLEEARDEDGFACEQLQLLCGWVTGACAKLFSLPQFKVKAVNFSAYGASFVHLDALNKPVTPLYNYLKPYPEALLASFYEPYGGRETFALQTASPALGMLNSGLQLYWLQHQRPEVFRTISCSLHLPQYISCLLTKEKYTDITSIGCHTGLWDFEKRDYHFWVYATGIAEKLAPLRTCDDAISVSAPGNDHVQVGIGLHDSSAALIPYLLLFKEPFVLLSTGTWCISLNPFNQTPLSKEELRQDCLCYLTHEGVPVKAARIFAGYEHEQQCKRIAAHFGVDRAFYLAVDFDAQAYARLQQEAPCGKETNLSGSMLQQSGFAGRDLLRYPTAAAAYHQLILDLVRLQHTSTGLVLAGSTVQRIFVDGGFSNNPVYMNGLAAAFPHMEVCAASMAQASALGAALLLHRHWHGGPLPSGIIALKQYRAAQSGVPS